MRGTILIALLLIIALFMPVEVWAQGCSMCKAVVEGETGAFGGEAMGRGLNNGILYLMAIPYLLLFMLFRKRIVAFVRELSSAQG